MAKSKYAPDGSTYHDYLWRSLEEVTRLMFEEFLVWVCLHEGREAVAERGRTVVEVIGHLQAGQAVCWGAFQRASYGVLWLASLAHANGFAEVGEAWDETYRYLCTLAGYDEGEQ